jgi:helix-turn-helix protein
MSIHVMNLVWGSTLKGSSRRFVLLALADRADDEGYCWPGIQSITRKTGLSASAVRRACKGLEVDLLVLRERRWTERGDRDTNGYWINIKALEAMQHPQVSARGAHPMAQGGWVQDDTTPCHGEGTGGVMVTPNTSVDPPVSHQVSKDSAIAASSLRDDGQGVFVQDRNKDHKHEDRSYPAEWDAEDEAMQIAEDRTERLLDRLASDPDIVWFEGCEETMARSMFGRGECYEYVKNKILKDRRNAPAW